MPRHDCDRDDLKAWEAKAVHKALRMIVQDYEANRFDEVAPLDLKALEDHLVDAVGDAAFPAWKELDPVESLADEADRGDWLYEQKRDREMGL